MNRQSGFTLIELLIAMAIFVVLGMACWRLFDGVASAERSSVDHQLALRSLMRAVAVIERDVLQVVESHPGRTMLLDGGLLNFQRGNWRNPLDQLRSELQEVSYTFEGETLWRYSRAVGQAEAQRQKLLEGVTQVRWRLFDEKSAWRSEWPVDAKMPMAPPQAVELQFSSPRFGQIRRVFILPQAVR
ncbi:MULTISPECIES: type II secretion system minor pseudopilin GspJ [Pseudomonas]|uniref:Type II secretion system protein J n=1 Tax=Pseudomonas baetica TaxID=674054 RepID=A0ABX4PZ52_9PSED|nr:MULTISPECIES: type II secretion system minor pseudopilin GspJ [Pseudomonas]MDR9860639.1 type II secretion system minor pseudopilin GspJ [Pseudomonas baetica]PKA69794.1 general secretion pathway protein J [Pseudomonas baetica]PTC21445.1 type II secretion system protein GspJ [Pseudomonas baetica]